jgi:hypothetical protein
MAFQIDGFLGGDEEPRIAKAHTCCAPSFALADPPPRDSSKLEAVPKLYAAGPVRRAVELFQGRS